MRGSSGTKATSSEQPLFRYEAVAARSTQWVGTIVLLRPIPMRLAAAIATVLTVSLITYATVGEYTRKVRVSGHIVPAAGVIKVVAPQFGRVLGCRVRDGETVKAGQVIYELTSEREGQGGGIDERIELSLAERRELLTQERNLQAQQIQQHERSLQARRKLIQEKIARLNQEIILQQERIVNVQKIVDRYRVLHSQGFVSEFQLMQYENDRREQLARKHSLERDKLATTQELVQVKEEADQLAGQLRLSTGQTERTLASLDQESAEHEARSRVQILAPVGGTVTALRAEPGQAVNAGAALATVIPASSVMEAHLMAPSHAIGFLEPGQAVLLRLSAFPYQKFGQVQGTVMRVENSPISDTGGDSATSYAATSEPEYRIVVRLSRQSLMAYGKEQGFRPGMTLEADIRQDRRRLIDWVLDPLISVTKARAG